MVDPDIVEYIWLRMVRLYVRNTLVAVHAVILTACCVQYTASTEVAIRT